MNLFIKSNKLTNDFRINNFDLIRLFAATQVLIFHSIKHLKIIEHSTIINLFAEFHGVPMFFVISGFLLSASFERNSGLKNYFKNRFLRIYPALWVCIILSVLVIYILVKTDFFSFAGIKWLFCQLIGIIYTPAFLKNYGFGFYNGSLWTIPIELQFYILLPFIYGISKLLAMKDTTLSFFILFLFIVFSVITYFNSSLYAASNFTVETTGQRIFRYTFVPHFNLFLLGIVLQRFKIWSTLFFQNRGLIWFVLYSFFSIFVPYGALQSLTGNILLGFFTISVAYTIPGISKRILKENDISYGVYIYHGLILGILVHFNVLQNIYFVLLVLIPSYLTAFISWRFVEKRCLRWKTKPLRPIDTLH